MAIMSRLALLALAAAVVVAKKKESAPSAVLELTDDNFDTMITENDPILVAFVAPWCGHCKKLKPEFEKAAKALQADGHKLGQVDASANNGVAKRFGIQGFPTLKFFKNGEPVEYNGGRDQGSIVNWVRRRAGSAVSTISTKADADALLEKHEVIAIVFSTAADSALAKAASHAGSHLEDATVALVVGDSELRTAYNVGAGDAVVSVNSFEGEDNVITASADDIATFTSDADKLGAWISSKSMPLVVTFSQETAPKIFRGDIKTHFLLFADPESDESTHTDALAQFRRAAGTGRDIALFVNVPPSEDRVMGYFGITAEEAPAAVLVSMPEGGGASMKKYRFPAGKALAEKEFTDFLNEYKAGNIKPFLKSEPVPEASVNEGAAVRTVVGSNFQSEVMDSEEDVLLAVVASWCGHCKAMKPAYEALGKAIQERGIKGVRIARMDGTANEVDHPAVQVRGFPTLYFFPAGKKDTPIDFDGNRDAEGFVDFLAKHATNGFELSASDIPVEAGSAE